jgi:diguanylate cyclase (GGDEF)-like protein
VADHDFGEPGIPVRVTISIGVASYPDERVSDVQTLLQLADGHLYRAKSEGRNRFRD